MTLTAQQIPIHTHPFIASTAGATQTSPADQVIAQSGPARRLHRGYDRPRIWRRRPSAPSAAASRTRTSSRTSASPSSFRCSASSRPRPEEERDMSDPFVAEIRMFAGNFAPTGWAAVQRPAPADLPEHRPVLAARDVLRRGWQVDLCAAEPPGLRPRSARGRARGSANTDLGQSGGSTTITLLDVGDAAAHAHPARELQHRPTSTTRRRPGHSPGRARASSISPTRPRT